MLSTGYYRWALTEPVDVTAVNDHTALIARVLAPGAFTVEATEDGELLINGKPETIGTDDLAALCERADVVLAGGRPFIGSTFRLENGRAAVTR